MSENAHIQISQDIIEGATNAELLKDLTSQHGYARDVNTHVKTLMSLIAEIPSIMPWDVVTPEAFREKTKSLPSTAKLGAFWLDLTNQALMLSALTAWKGRSLVQSLIRSLNSRELIAPALLSRASLELATSTLVHVREAIGAFNAVATSEKPVFGNPEQMARIEETLTKAIWGTRIGSSKLPDKTPLWERSPYPEGTVEATSVLTSFQKIARDAPDPGVTAFKVYEWLCDLVHPTTQGLRVFWESCAEVAPGHRRLTIKHSGAGDQSVVHALVLWATGYSSATLVNTIGGLVQSATGARARLATTYQLPGAARLKAK